MPKIDLHVVAVPDHRAHMTVAQIITGSNPAVSMPAAMDMAKAAPLLLFHNVELKDVEQHIRKLKNVGVVVKATAPKPTSADRDSTFDEVAKIKAHNATINRNAPGAPPLPVNTVGGNVPPSPAADGNFQRDSSYVGKHKLSDPTHVGKPGLRDLAKMEKRSNRNSIIITLIITGISAIFAMVLYFTPEGSASFTSSRPRSGMTIGSGPNTVAAATETITGDAQKSAGIGSAQQPTQQTAASNAAAPATEEKQPNRTTPQQREQANTYIDSARASSGENLEGIIAFYRLAISFNRYNLAAWQGLLQAYRDIGSDKEARETETQMNEIFGNRITSLGYLIGRFGELSDVYTAEDGTYRVEYKTRKRSRNDVLLEIFNLTRSVRIACNCDNISIYASTGSGGGMFVQSRAGTSIHSLSAFSRQASISWLE